MKLIFVISIIATTLISVKSFAQNSIFIDREIVQNFAEKSILGFNQNDAKVKVIVSFKPSQSLQGNQNFKSIQFRMNFNAQRIAAFLKKQAPILNQDQVANLWIANAFVADLTKDQLNALMQSDEIQSIVFADHQISINKNKHIFSGPFLNPQAPMTYGLRNIGVNTLVQKYPQYDGAGVAVGIIDTGIDDTHPDLKGRLKIFKNFSPATSPVPGDGFGHGTHVAGTIAGGSFSGTRIGVAPKSDLVVARIFDSDGNSTRELILQAMQWMTDPDGKPETNDAPRVVNSSWGDDDPYNDRDPQDEPLCAAVSNWQQLGIAGVFSAGNTGPKEKSINLPASCPDSFSVAATEEWDRSPWFSSSGPAVWKSVELAKPEVSAPGFEVYSSIPRNDYEKYSGTSMAAPHVTGSIALLLQKNPHLSVAEIKNVMQQTAKDLGSPGQDSTFGFGRIDIFKGIEF